MPHDAARLDETRSWLNKASKDLRAAAHDLQAAPPLLEDVDFHCQQAAEKVLKGFLVCGGNGEMGTMVLLVRIALSRSTMAVAK